MPETNGGESSVPNGDKDRPEPRPRREPRPPRSHLLRHRNHPGHQGRPGDRRPPGLGRRRGLQLPGVPLRVTFTSPSRTRAPRSRPSSGRATPPGSSSNSRTASRSSAAGKVDVYPPRGYYQLIIDQAEPKGKGALQLAFEQLKEKLRAEGLFAPERKKKLPLLPKTIGVVTSPAGAALIDILRTIERRFAKVRILIYPAQVQGDGAAAEIVERIDVSRRPAPTST